MTITISILVFLGIILFPIFTLSVILFATGHWVLGSVALIMSLLKG